MHRDVFVRHRDGRAAALAQRAQHEEVAERLRHANSGRERPRFRPRLRFVCAFIERAHDRCAARRLRRHESRARVGAEKADLAQLVERLPHADEANTAAGRIDDHVRQLPAELLRELEAHRLLPLDAVGLLQRRGVVPAPLGAGALHDRAGVADRARDEPHVRTVRGGLALDHVRRRLGHHDDHAEAGARAVGGPRRAGIARGRQRQRGHAQLLRARDANGGAARLERAGRQQALVLDLKRFHADGLPQTRRAEERRGVLAERHDVRVLLHRQELAHAPQGRGTHPELLGFDRAVHARQVVAHEERTTVACARLLDGVDLVVLGAARALEVRREARHAARSIFAPRGLRRSSSIS